MLVSGHQVARSCDRTQGGGSSRSQTASSKLLARCAFDVVESTPGKQLNEFQAIEQMTKNERTKEIVGEEIMSALRPGARDNLLYGTKSKGNRE